MKPLEAILGTKTASTAEMLRIYDELPPATIDYMMGRWKGSEIATGHQMNDLLEPAGWYGKVFVSKEEVHPLVFFGKGKTELYALNPRHIPLHMKFPKTKIIGALIRLARPFMQTRRSKARLRMVEHRGKMVATMIYDDKAIYDHFVKIDDNTVLGCMDLKGMETPVFWIMKRDDSSNYKMLF
jgi:hypothetical protein